MELTGLAPYLPPGRPRAGPRWWIARGELETVSLSLDERGALPEPRGVCGLAAPTTLPDEFLAFLEERGVALAGLTAKRLAALARAFAARRTRGTKHPLRCGQESLSALDRRRLPLHLASLPLLHTSPVEVDVPAFLRSLELPCAALSGARADAVRSRAEVLSALQEGVLGFPVNTSDRDLAVASFDALRAVVAAAAAAWVERNGKKAEPFALFP